MDDIVYSWLAKNTVEFEDGMEMPQFRMENFSLHDCSQNYTTGGWTVHKT